MDVYVDGYFLLNFLTDYLLLQGAGYLSGGGVQGGRLILGALLGAVFGVVSLLPGFRFLSGGLWEAVFFLLMVWAAFGWGWQLLRRGLLTGLLAMALGGCAYLLRQKSLLSFLSLLAASVGLILACRAANTGGAGLGDLIRVRIRLGERRVELTALRDTGNSLKDPITGSPVLVAQWEAAERLLPGGLNRDSLKNPAQAMTELRGKAPGLCLRLIPYKAVGQEGGLLLAVRCDEVRAGKRRLGNLVAFSPTNLCETGTYQALTGGYGA